MRKIIFLSFLITSAAMAKGQEFSADKLIDMLSLSSNKLNVQLVSKKYQASEPENIDDTVVISYQNSPELGFGKKKQNDTISRKFCRTEIRKSSFNTYQTTSSAEYRRIIQDLKKKGFYCDYEKDSTVSHDAYLYQHDDITTEVSVKKQDDTTWYSFIFHKKVFSLDKEIIFAEDLLQFTSHEYLVYYFGPKNVKKDIYYFGKNDIANCSVLLINTNRQVIFIWKDGLNRRKIGNILLGGQHKLKSQEGKDSVTSENTWLLKSGIHIGMSLYDLRMQNNRNIAFCGGDAPNPGLIFPESGNKVDFKNTDVILGCMNCDDDRFLQTKIMYADQAMKDGRVLAILTIVIYPVNIDEVD